MEKETGKGGGEGGGEGEEEEGGCGKVVGLGEVVDPCGLVLRKEKPIMIDWKYFRRFAQAAAIRAGRFQRAHVPECLMMRRRRRRRR